MVYTPDVVEVNTNNFSSSASSMVKVAGVPTAKLKAWLSLGVGVAAGVGVGVAAGMAVGIAAGVGTSATAAGEMGGITGVFVSTGSGTVVGTKGVPVGVLVGV